MRYLFSAAIVFVAVAIVGATWWVGRSGAGGEDPFAQCRGGAVGTGTASIGGPLSLVDENGQAVTEADIEAGRYDGATVEAWLVNWAEPDQRLKQFRGRIGEITRAGGAFRAEDGYLRTTRLQRYSLRANIEQRIGDQLLNASGRYRRRHCRRTLAGGHTCGIQPQADAGMRCRRQLCEHKDG